jgi:hypothetical protein
LCGCHATIKISESRNQRTLISEATQKLLDLDFEILPLKTRHDFHIARAAAPTVSWRVGVKRRRTHSMRKVPTL